MSKRKVITPISPYVYPGIRKQDIPKKIKSLNSLNKIDILKMLCEEGGTTPDMLASKIRTTDLVDLRKIYCKIMRDKYGLPLKEIGDVLGGRDHTTIIHNVEKFNNFYKYNDPFKHKADTILNKLQIFF